MMHLSTVSLLAVLPPLAGGNFGRTYLNPVPIVLVAAACVAYGWGVVAQNRLHPRHPWPVARTLAFIGGVVVTIVAICSFLGAYDTTLFWVHMVQHLMLIMIAAPLFAVSSPIALALGATKGPAHRRILAVLRSRPGRIVGHPVTAFVLYGLLIPVTHLTVLFNYAIEWRALDECEHLAFLLVGYLFWRQILGADPNRYRAHPAIRALLLFLAVPVDTFVGLSLNSENHEIFPALAALHRTWGPSLVMDLHVGGVIMWVGGDSLMMLALIPVVVQWVRIEERKAKRADRELEMFFLPERRRGQPTAGFALGSYVPAPAEPTAPAAPAAAPPEAGGAP